MATFPYFDATPETNGRVSEFTQATETVDVVVRNQYAAWLLQAHRGATEAVTLYYTEMTAGNITTEPVSGDYIRAYEVARNLLELSDRGSDWATAVTTWGSEFIALAGIVTSDAVFEWNLATSLLDVNEQLPMTSDENIFFFGSLLIPVTDVVTTPISTAQVDTGCFLGDLNDTKYQGGVRVDNQNMTMFGSPNGKYGGDISADWVGTVFTASNGLSVVIPEAINAQTFRYAVVSNPTGLSDDDAAVQGFAHPNTFTVDFSRSTHTMAETEALRAAVEPDEVLMPEPSVDGSCFLGDFTNSAYTNGVWANSKNMTFLGSANAGKYVAKVTGGWVGTVLTASNGLVVEISSVSNTVTFAYTIVSNPTGLSDADAAQQGFEYPNTFELDFSSSTLSIAEQRTLRVDAGDSGWISMPSNFEIEMDCQFTSNPGYSAYVFDSGQSSDTDRVSIIRVLAQDTLYATVKIGGLSVNISHSVQTGTGVDVNLKLSYDGATISMTVDGVTETTAHTGALSWPSVRTTIGQQGFTGTKAQAMSLKNFIVRDLDSIEPEPPTSVDFNTNDFDPNDF